MWSIGVVFFEMLFGIDEWYMNFVEKQFGENLVYPKNISISYQTKFLLYKFINTNIKQSLKIDEMLYNIKITQDPLTLKHVISFTDKLETDYKEFEKNIGKKNKLSYLIINRC